MADIKGRAKTVLSLVVVLFLLSGCQIGGGSQGRVATKSEKASIEKALAIGPVATYPVSKSTNRFFGEIGNNSGKTLAHVAFDILASSGKKIASGEIADLKSGATKSYSLEQPSEMPDEILSLRIGEIRIK